MPTKPTALLAVFTLATACSDAAPAADTPTAPAEANVAEKAAAAAVAPEIAKAAAEAKASPPAASGEPVDVCALFTKTDVESAIGELMEDPKADAPQGSLLGGCSAMSKTMVMASVSARPSGEYDATVEYATKKEPGKKVDGLGAGAVSTPVGLMIKLEGKPYFLSVLAGKMGKMDHAVAEAVARKLKL